MSKNQPEPPQDPAKKTPQDTDISYIRPIPPEELAQSVVDGDMDDGSEKICDAEKRYIERWREIRGDEKEIKENLTGLALSGGGIRSATFCLGVMQALAKANVFHKFDYLSTVSGGGYIGSSITWLKNQLAGDDHLNDPKAFSYGDGSERIQDSETGKKKQAQLLKYLWGHGNYLTPGEGITMASFVGVILRGIVLNLLVWVPLVVALMFFLILAGEFSKPDYYKKQITKPDSHEEKITNSNLKTFQSWVSENSEKYITGFFGCNKESDKLQCTPESVTSLQSAASQTSTIKKPEQIEKTKPVTSTESKAPSGSEVSGKSTDSSESVQKSYLAFECQKMQKRPLLCKQFPAYPFFFLLFVLSLILIGLLTLAFILYSLGSRWSLFLVSRLVSENSEEARYKYRRFFEDWMRVMFLIIGVLFVFGTIPIVDKWIDYRGGIGSVLAGLGSAFWGFKKSSSEKGKGIVPLGFVASLGSVLILYGFTLLSFKIADGLYPIWWVWGTIFLAGSFVTGWFVNVNYISIHRYYRDRLMESFMPDVKDKLDKARFFDSTGSAKDANEKFLHDLQTRNNIRSPYHIINTNAVLVDSKNRVYRVRGGDNFILSPGYCGSNATGWLNSSLFMGGGLTLATAKAISGAAANPNTGVGGKGLTRNRFLSVLMALLNLRLGYWIPNFSNIKKKKEVFRRYDIAKYEAEKCMIELVKIYDDLEKYKIVSENYREVAVDLEESRKPIAECQKLRPNHYQSAKYEVVKKGYNEGEKFLQISDGGHFENLGLYELIRRRLKLIVVCDAGADPKFSFSDLQNALKKIWVDFGARIDFYETENQLERLIATKPYGYPQGEKYAEKGYVEGVITYADGFRGTFIFIKTTMVKDANFEVKGYKGANPDFPDESTADQFFDEEQFDAYRKLGLRIGNKMMEEMNLKVLMGYLIKAKT